jgi:hypothetical protein
MRPIKPLSVSSALLPASHGTNADKLSARAVQRPRWGRLVFQFFPLSYFPA